MTRAATSTRTTRDDTSTGQVLPYTSRVSTPLPNAPASPPSFHPTMERNERAAAKELRPSRRGRRTRCRVARRGRRLGVLLLPVVLALLVLESAEGRGDLCCISECGCPESSHWQTWCRLDNHCGRATPNTLARCRVVTGTWCPAPASTHLNALSDAEFMAASWGTSATALLPPPPGTPERTPNLPGLLLFYRNTRALPCYSYSNTHTATHHPAWTPPPARARYPPLQTGYRIQPQQPPPGAPSPTGTQAL